MFVTFELAKIGPDAQAAVPALIEGLKTTSGYAARALVKIAEAEHIPALVRALARAHASDRDLITARLDEIGPAPADAVPRHIQALKDNDTGGTIWATAFLIKAGPEDKAAVPPLIDALKDDNPQVRAWAASVMIKIGPAAKETIPALTKAQNDSEGRVRWRATLALGAIGQSAVSAAQRDAEWPKSVWNIVLVILVTGILYLVARSVYRSRSRFRVKVQHLVVVILVGGCVYFSYLASIREFPLPVGSAMFRMKYGNQSVRSRAADELNHGTGGVPNLRLVLEALREGLFENSPDRHNAIGSLGLLAPSWRHDYGGADRDTQAAVPVLIEALSDEDGRMRERAVVVLGHFDRDAKPAVPALIVALQDWSANRAAAAALGKIGPEAKAAVPGLREVSIGPDKLAAAEAFLALNKIESIDDHLESAVSALAEGLKNKNWLVRQQAAKRLGTLGPAAKTAVPALLEVMKDESGIAGRQYRQFRKAAAEALKKIESEAGNTEREP